MSPREGLLQLAVIDDHPLVRAGLNACLDGWEHGQVVMQAENGEDYERQLPEVGHIHIALVDLRMPRRDGFETMRWMQRHQPRTRAIAISYDPTPNDIVRALRAGARAMLPKAVPKADLLKALDHVRLTGFHFNEMVSRELRREVEDMHQQQAPEGLWARLTEREREFLLKYTDPRVPTLQDTARRMGVKPETAETYRKHVAAKLNAHTKSEMVRCVLTNGWEQRVGQ